MLKLMFDDRYNDSTAYNSLSQTIHDQNTRNIMQRSKIILPDTSSLHVSVS